MHPLGFRFDAAAAVVDGVAHTDACSLVARLPPAGRRFPTGGVLRAEFCPRVCPRCEPKFETLLSYELDSASAPVVADARATLTTEAELESSRATCLQGPGFRPLLMP